MIIFLLIIIVILLFQHTGQWKVRPRLLLLLGVSIVLTLLYAPR